MNLYQLHISNPDVFRQFAVKDILFLYYKCPQKERILQLHSTYNQFVFSLAGGRKFHQGDNSFLVNKNSGYLMRRAGFLQEMRDDIKGWELLAFYIQDDYLKKIFNGFRDHLPLGNLPPTPSEMMICLQVDDRVRGCYLSLLPYFDQTASLPEEILEIKLKELLYNVFIHPGNRSLLSYVNSLADGHVTPLWEVMEANYMYNLTLGEFAHLAHRSLSTFKRDFSAYYRTTPGRWLAEKRLERAKVFLLTTDKPIGEIAFENGFGNLSHFSRVFKARFGYPPTSLRKGSR